MTLTLTITNMAFSQREQAILLNIKEKGGTAQDAIEAINNFRTGKKRETPRFSEAVQNYGERTAEQFTKGVSRIGEAITGGAENILNTKPGSYERARGAALTGTESASGALQAGFAPITAALEPAVKYGLEKTKQGIDVASDTTLLQKIATNPVVSKTLDTIFGGLDKAKQWITDNPQEAKILANTAELATVGSGATPAKEALARGGSAVVDTTARARSLVGDGLSFIKNKNNRSDLGIAPELVTAPKTIDELAVLADKAIEKGNTTELANIAQQGQRATIVEKMAGLQNDIKNRIAGKADKLKEYFDVAHARNNLDTIPTPLEYAASKVDDAVSKMYSVLNDTGSKIGAFRTKIASIQAPIEQITRIEKSFTDGLAKLNLEIKDGIIQQIKGTVRKIGSKGDVNVLQDLYKQLLVVKGAPNIERLIDLRSLFDSTINFAKSAREASSSVDPLSRAVRGTIADVAAKTVGKTQAQLVTKYSDFIDILNELRSYTERKAGGEFLLKRVLSERGGDPRKLIQTVKDITGIDLLDDATMAQIATDLIGNARQKGLFRQEIEKAGLDIAGLLRGNPNGAIMLMVDFLKNKAIDPEKIFMKAAESAGTSK